jgi:hypothetical protein
LEWPLRLAVVWQQVAETPVRQTLQRDFFKRDLQRLQTDALLNGSFADQPAGVPDCGLLCVAWARAAGLLEEHGAELRAGRFAATWDQGLFPLLRELWRALLGLDAWDPDKGWEANRAKPHPFPSAYLLVLLVLDNHAAEAWVKSTDIEEWLLQHHPYWQGHKKGDSTNWFSELLLGLLFQLRLIQCTEGTDKQWLVRLSPFGRSLIRGTKWPEQPEFRQTLMVQANFEVLAFRQGITPALIAQLSHFARWKTLGTACMLELQAEQVYRGLESGLHLQEITNLLQRHGMRDLPDNVSEALRTWSNKRDRIVVYERATLLEFASAADLNTAMARGLIELRLSDRIGLVRSENDVDFRQFRLSSTRDYGSKPEQCLQPADDGVTFVIDNSRSDLLLELEIARIAEAIPSDSENERAYRLTHQSLRTAFDTGMTLQRLEEWLLQRSGRLLSAAARLLALPEQQLQLQLEHCLVLTTPTPEMADGLMQLPATRRLIQRRLGPTALVVAEGDVPALRQEIANFGQKLD